MSSDGLEIRRLAPLFLASLALHLPVALALAGYFTTGLPREERPLVLMSVPDRDPVASLPHAISPPAAVKHAGETKPPKRAAEAENQSAAATPVFSASPPPAAAPMETATMAHPVDAPNPPSQAIARAAGTSQPAHAGGNAAVQPPVSATGAGRHGVGAVASTGRNNQGAGGTPSGGRRDAPLGRREYQETLKRLIEAHKRYPLAARKSGREGSCRRRFVVARDGALKKVEEVSSCGNPFLDEAATRAITANSSFPPLPEDFTGAEESFTVAITFSLSGK